MRASPSTSRSTSPCSPRRARRASDTPQGFARVGRLGELARWLEGGGALLSVETAWGQIQLGHATGVDDLAANQLLSEYGILYTARALSPGRDGTYILSAEASAAANASDALGVLA
ncbi:MAG: hypothetical protein AAFV77_14035, partial [Planctomycetota bacterium]